MIFTMVIAAIAKSIWTCVAAPVQALGGEGWSAIMSCDDNMETLGEKMSELRRRKEEVNKTIHDAERSGKVPSPEVVWWLQMVQKLQEQTERLDLEFKGRRWKCIAGFSLDFCVSYRLSKKAEKKTLKAIEYNDRKFTSAMAIDSDMDSYDNRISGRSLEGMGLVVNQLNEYMEDDSIFIIGIHGMGGVGKTALLEKFRDEYLPNNNICKALIDMKDRPNVEETQKAVGEKLRLIWKANTKDGRKREIFDFLTKKDFILFLDNVWEKIDLEEVGIPRNKQKSKIIIATRITDVCDHMDCDNKVRVECLQWKEAWNLFVEKAGKELINSDVKIKNLAMILAKKCGGLPLALVTVGRAMASKKTWRQWESASRAIDTAVPSNIDGLAEKVLTRLQTSYENLTEKQQKCLLYCTMFPEDRANAIEKTWIIDHCIGEGIIDDNFDDANDIYYKGYELLGYLQTASLLESGADEDQIMMHPMIRLLAMWIASGYGGGNKMLVQAKNGLTEAQIEKWVGAERISLMMNKIKALSTIPDCPSLLTLLLQHNRRLEIICNGFFNTMRELRVLNLSRTSIKELPAEIKELIGLQYLDLTETKITSLPKDLALLKLRFLLLENTPDLKTIPDGLIEELSALQVLYMHVSYGDWKVGSTGTGVDFEELIRLRQLKALGITIESEDALKKLAGSTKLAMSTCHVHMRGCPGLRIVSPTKLERKHKALKSLQISDSRDLEEVVISGDGGSSDDDDDDYNDGNNSANLHLELLTLKKLHKACIIWEGGSLQNLTTLNISFCNGMERLIYCAGVEEYGWGTIPALIRLKKMTLCSLQNLKSISGGKRALDLPSLEVLEVEKCPNLKKITIIAEKLKDIGSDQSWWNQLEWEEDDNLKSMFPQLNIMNQESAEKSLYI